MIQIRHGILSGKRYELMNDIETLVVNLLIVTLCCFRQLQPPLLNEKFVLNIALYIFLFFVRIHILLNFFCLKQSNIMSIEVFNDPGPTSAEIALYSHNLLTSTVLCKGQCSIPANFSLSNLDRSTTLSKHTRVRTKES